MSTIKLENIQTRTGSGTITIGASGETVQIGSGAINNLGITMADQWRLTASLTNPGDSDITANLERVDNATFAKIGTGMTESSGIFTFPTTGLYYVEWKSILLILSDSAVFFNIDVSSDSGSSYDNVTGTIMGEKGGTGSAVYNAGSGSAFVNVTNASTFRVKFSLSSTDANTNLPGSTDINRNHFNFIRLGDSQ